MILIPNAKRKSFGVFGLGVSGMATCEALSASGAVVYSWDENKAACEKTSGTEFRAEHPKNWPWKDLSAVIVSPGVPLTHPKPHPVVRKARLEKLPVIGDIELFAQAINTMAPRERARVCAITGSNGKSTTTALITHTLNSFGEDAFMGGNIGDPILSLPEPDRHTIYVIELSSFQLDLTYSLRADAAVMLNISPDHLDRHGSMDAYVQSKKRIFRNQTEDDLAIVGVDDSYGEAIFTELTAKGRTNLTPLSAGATLGRGVYVLGGQVFYNFDGKTACAGDANELSGLRGLHNQQNIAASVAACRHFGVEPSLAIKSAHNFGGLAHRMEEVGRAGAVTFINDSKATNANAAMNAISAFDDVYWIAGGQSKEGGIGELRDRLSDVKGAYFYGAAAAEFKAQIGDAAPTRVYKDLDKALAAAYKDAMANKGGAVLLSPACASFDQFKNFEDRGDTFRRLVGEITTASGEAA